MFANTPFVYSKFLFWFFVKHDDQHKGNLWQPPNSSFWLLALSSVVARSLVVGLLFTCCDLLCTLDDACLTQVDRLKNIAHFHGCGALRLNAATSAEQTHQRLGVAEGINSELQEQLQRVSAGHQVPHEALQSIIHQGMNLLRCQIETRSRIRLVEPKSLMPDRFGKKTGPSWRTWSYWARDFVGVVHAALKQAMKTA